MLFLGLTLCIGASVRVGASPKCDSKQTAYDGINTCRRGNGNSIFCALCPPRKGDGVKIICILSISRIQSYVLLAANIEDFKSLAKRLVPDSMTDEILAIESDYGDSIKKIDNWKESFASESNKQFQENRPYQKAKESSKRHRLHLDRIVEEVKHKIQNEFLSPNKEKKRKKPDEVDNFTSKSRNKNKSDTKYASDFDEKSNLESKIKGKYEKDSNHNAKYQQVENNQNKKNKRDRKPRIQDNRYVADLFVASSPKNTPKRDKVSRLRPNKKSKQDKLTTGANIQMQSEEKTTRHKYTFHKENNKEREYRDLPYEEDSEIKEEKHFVRPEKHKIHFTTKETQGERFIEGLPHNYDALHFTKEDKHQLFHLIQMNNKNDSYEDYVTPKKDYSDDETPTTLNNYNNNSEIFSHQLTSTRKHRDVIITPKDKYKLVDKFSDELSPIDNDKGKKVSFITKEYKSVKYKWNKKKRFDIQKQTEHNNMKLQQLDSIKADYMSADLTTEPAQETEQPIQPYAQKISKVTPEYEDETQKAVRDEIKARTDNLNLDYDQSKDILLKITDTLKITTKKKVKGAAIRGSVIPKRDFYKISSPNYLAKIPVVGEKYKFDEPIPEEDREPEEFKPIKKPPSRINGKIRIT